jgi:hypothetical protein
MMNSPIRILSCCLYILSVASILLNVQSYRQALVFLMSFTFQTNSLTFVYFALGDKIPLRWRSILQRLTVVWATFMAIMWFSCLGGNETTANEKVVNHLLHYYQPLLCIADWLIKPALSWSSHAYLYLPTLISMGLLFAIGKYHLGYHIYPFFGRIDELSQIQMSDLTTIGGIIVMIIAYFVAGFTIYATMLFVVVDIIAYQINEDKKRKEHAYEE